MRGSLLSIALVVWLALPCRAEGCAQRVAIIGGGIGGSYAAYLMSNYTATSSVALDVYVTPLAYRAAAGITSLMSCRFDTASGGGRAQEFTFDGEVTCPPVTCCAPWA
jgi:hypothetical protein